MAVINRNSLVLNSVSVVRGVVTGTVGMGFDPANEKLVAIPFSMRPRSYAFAQAGQETSLRQGHAARRGADIAAERAGRPVGAGVRASRSPAWFPATRGACSTAAWRFGRLTAKPPASVGNVLPEAGLAGSKPAGGALPASARGVAF
jgi:hypothetical protein